MAALLAHMNDMLQNPYEGKVQHGLDFIALGKLFEDLGHWDEAARLFERGLESQLNEADFGLAVKRLSILQKKRGDIGEAIRLWESAAERGHLYAFIELAKYYEHKQRDAKSRFEMDKICADACGKNRHACGIPAQVLDGRDRTSYKAVERKAV
jgi:tetratricopeptide (TPR) repeat protein